MNYDFSNYKTHNERGILKGAWEIAVPPIEIEAKNDFEQINQKDLRHYLFLIIKECYVNRNKVIDKVYYKRKNDLIKGYQQKKHLDSKLNEMEVKIIENYNRDFHFYKTAIVESKKDNLQDQRLLDFITDKAMSTIAGIKYYIDKLIYITDFKINLEKSILKVGLFEKVNQPETLHFIDLFKDLEQYHKISALLIKDSVMAKTESGSVVLCHENIGELDPDELLSALAYLLHSYNYLNTTSKTKITSALKNSFGFTFTDRTLRNKFHYYNNLIDLNSSNYINHFHMIKPLYN